MADVILGPQTIKRLEGPIYKVWQAVGPDAEGFVESNEEAVELCIDAGRLIAHANDIKAEAYLFELLDCYDYQKVLRYLATHIHLI